MKSIFYVTISYKLNQGGPTRGLRAVYWPATVYSVAHRSIQEKSANVNLLKSV